MAAFAFLAPAAQAQDAYDQGVSSYYDGQDAMSNPSDEGAHYDAGQTFDGYGTAPVDTTSPYEGSSGLDYAPTYSDDAGSGLDNAPYYGDE